MNNKSKNLLSFTHPVFLAMSVFLAAPAVHAEDVEIYYNAENSGNSGQILFLLDTSGSMIWCEEEVRNRWGGAEACADVPNRRVNQMKTAFSNLLDTLSGDLEVGVGRFNQYQRGVGGYVVYPVRRLDDPDFDGVSITRISNGDADGWQENNGTLHLSGDSMDLPNGGTTNGTSGFVFEGVDVPRHAPVSEAYLVVEADSRGSDDLTMDVQYELSPSPGAFDGQDIDSRVWSSPVTVAVIDDWNNGDQGRVDITPVIRQALARTGWCGGNNLALRFSSTSPSDTRSREIGTSENNDDPELHIHWDARAALTVTSDPTTDPAGYQSELACGKGQRQGIDSGTDDGQEDLSSGEVDLAGEVLEIDPGSTAVGLRFPVIPFDARSGQARPDVIKSATLHVRGHSQETCGRGGCWGGVNSGSTTFVIKAMGGSSDSFDGDVDADLSGRSLLGGEVRYTTSAADDDFARWHEVDVTSVARAALSDADWSANSHLGLYITGEGTAVEIHGRESGGANAAYLTLEVASAELANYVPRVRDRLKEVVNDFDAAGGTPLMESYSEMARYMMGLASNYGNASTDEATGFTDQTRNQYDTPVDGLNQCETASVVMMTDGEPSVDTGYGKVNEITGVNRCHNNESGEVEKSFACQTHLAGWLYDSTRNSQEIPVRTHMVGFYLDDTTINRMETVTNAGNGITASANNVESLQEAFSRIVNAVTVDNSNMAAPGVSVNQLNRFQFLDQLYYGVFKPSNSSPWLGNLKRYRLKKGNPAADDPADRQSVILDEDGSPAVDPNNGFFRDTAQSYWSEDADGPDVTMGGARGELVPEDRKLFVLTSNPGTDSGQTDTAPGALTEIPEFSSWDDADVSPEDLGLVAGATEEERRAVFDFLRNSWADPLHSEPRLVNYGLVSGATAEEAFGDPSKQKNVVFVSTNDGMLHAVDTLYGSEYFAFMPAETLSGAAARQGMPSIGQNPITRSTYGLDSSWTPWRIDEDNDFQADEVYLFGGMRRGGRNYYALDVSDLSAPKLMWSIQGGQGDYDNLGQTWSEPTRAWVRIGGDRVPVLIFGGGYSPADHDSADHVSGGDSVGNSIYIANAYTGDLIAEISDSGADVNNTDMDWSIPSSISVVDRDLDGNVDFLYAADLGGQIFRVDLDRSASSASDLVERAVTVASLGTSDAGNSDIGDHRRFYASPVVALNEDGGYRVVVGSGYRSHPLDEQTQDRFYAFDDPGIDDVLNGGGYSTTKVISPSDLLDVTTNLDPDPSELSGKDGWYVDLEAGEKVLASASVVDGRVFFTSYLPATESDNCSTVAGTARLYVVDLVEGSPAGDFDNDGTVSDERHSETRVPGLPPQPHVIVYQPDGPGPGGGPGGSGGGGDPCEAQISVLVGTRVMEVGNASLCGFHKTRWYEVPDKTAIDQIMTDHNAVE